MKWPTQLPASSLFVQSRSCYRTRANAAQWEPRRRWFSSSAPCTGCSLTVVVNAAVTRSGTVHQSFIDTPPARSRDEKEQEDEAVQDRGITTVEQRKEILWCVDHEVGYGHVT